MVTLKQTLKEAQKNDRICPQPQQWNELYKLLPNRKRQGSGWEPPLPLILAAWWDTPYMSKMFRLREHIEWADKHDCLEDIYCFLKNLDEKDWFHTGE